MLKGASAQPEKGMKMYEVNSFLLAQPRPVLAQSISTGLKNENVNWTTFHPKPTLIHQVCQGDQV